MVEIAIQNQVGVTIGRTECEKFLDMGDTVVLADGTEQFVLGELLEIDLAGHESQTVMVGPLAAVN